MRKIYFLAFVVLFCGNLFAQPAPVTPSGDGSSGNPYQIATLENLYWVTQDSSSWGGYFVQTADIDASGSPSWDGGAGFNPIGRVSWHFSGSYDGQGYKITGLFVNRSTTDEIGFFGVQNMQQ